MSSTNRHSERQPEDFYTTPIDAVKLFLREWANDDPQLCTIKRIFDPCAGGIMREGKVVTPMSYPAAIRDIGLGIFPQASIETMDIRGDSPADIIRDYLTTEPAEIPDLIITNPPFKCAIDVTDRALKHVRGGGYVVMLQRLNWLGSVSRTNWWQSHMPEVIYVHASRMGFKKHLHELPPKERNGTDSIEYAHFVWRKDVYPKLSRLRVI